VTPLRRSELRRKQGIQLRYKLGLIRCRKCNAFLIVRNRQRRKLCPYCGHRFWLDRVRVVFQYDSAELLRKIMGGTGNYYHPRGFIPAHLLAPKLGFSTGAFERQCSKERGM